MRTGPLRVLLFAPDPERDPPSGDTTYGQLLRATPPEAVEYTSYATALAQGSLTIRGRRPRHGAVSATDAVVLALKATEAALRGRVLFREPTWFVSVEPGRFDLLHTHLFAVRQIPRRIPVVSSAGYPLSVLYGHREGWSTRRTDVADAVRLKAARLGKVHVPGYFAPSGDLLTVYTDRYREWVIGRGQAPSTVRVVGQAIPPNRVVAATAEIETPVLGFIGRDFALKGGPAALDAFARVRAEMPTATLLVVTERGPAADHCRALPGVSVMTGLDASGVAAHALPRIDVLLAPTKADCGVPYGILEALSAGCAVAVTPNPWLDPRLGMLGHVRQADEQQLAVGALELLSQRTTESKRANAAAFAEVFVADQMLRDLRSVYDAAMNQAR